MSEKLGGEGKVSNGWAVHQLSPQLKAQGDKNEAFRASLDAFEPAPEKEGFRKGSSLGS